MVCSAVQYSTVQHSTVSAQRLHRNTLTSYLPPVGWGCSRKSAGHDHGVPSRTGIKSLNKSSAKPSNLGALNFFLSYLVGNAKQFILFHQLLYLSGQGGLPALLRCRYRCIACIDPLRWSPCCVVPPLSHYGNRRSLSNVPAIIRWPSVSMVCLVVQCIPAVPGFPRLPCLRARSYLPLEQSSYPRKQSMPSLRSAGNCVSYCSLYIF